MNKIHCFTHNDLDGVVTYMTVKWFFPECEFTVTNISSSTNLRDEVTKWMLNNKISDYKYVFFLDIDSSPATDLIDHPNVIIIDHHKTHLDNMTYKVATPYIKEYSSASLLAYKILRKLTDRKLTEAQLTLIILANDYDSYALECSESIILNTVFWKTNKSFESFCNAFANGFTGFTPQQLALYNIQNQDLQNRIKKLQCFRGVHVDEDGEARIVVATFSNDNINEVADYILATHEPDIAIVVNQSANRVSFRRQKNGVVKLNNIAEAIANGGGHEYAAGGQITPEFIEFTKLLKPI